jgi:hypothetical protein
MMIFGVLVMSIVRFDACLLDVSQVIVRIGQTGYPELRQLAVKVCKTTTETSDGSFQLHLNE